MFTRRMFARFLPFLAAAPAVVDAKPVPNLLDRCPQCGVETSMRFFYGMDFTTEGQLLSKWRCGACQEIAGLRRENADQEAMIQFLQKRCEQLIGEYDRLCYARIELYSQPQPGVTISEHPEPYKLPPAAYDLVEKLTGMPGFL